MSTATLWAVGPVANPKRTRLTRDSEQHAPTDEGVSPGTEARRRSHGSTGR